MTREEDCREYSTERTQDSQERAIVTAVERVSRATAIAKLNSRQKESAERFPVQPKESNADMKKFETFF